MLFPFPCSFPHIFSSYLSPPFLDFASHSFCIFLCSYFMCSVRFTSLLLCVTLSFIASPFVSHYFSFVHSFTFSFLTFLVVLSCPLLSLSFHFTVPVCTDHLLLLFSFLFFNYPSFCTSVVFHSLSCSMLTFFILLYSLIDTLSNLPYFPFLSINISSLSFLSFPFPFYVFLFFPSIFNSKPPFLLFSSPFQFSFSSFHLFHFLLLCFPSFSFYILR